MRLPQLQKMAEKFVSENASSLLTGVGVAGVIGTFVLASRAGAKASQILDAEERRRVEMEIPDAIEKTEYWGMCWRCYVPPVLVMGGTIAAIVAANRMSAQRAAALAAAYGLSESRFQEYKDKVLQKVGSTKEQAVRDEIAQDRVTEDKSSQVVVLTEGDVLCYDMLTGRYFRSSVEKIKKAENKLNAELIHHDSASLSTFYDDIGLPPTSYTDEVGWNQATDGVIEVQFSTTTSTDDRPCITIDFNIAPHPAYYHQY